MADDRPLEKTADEGFRARVKKLDEFYAAHPHGCLDKIGMLTIPGFAFYDAIREHIQMRKAGLRDSFFPDMGNALYIESVKGMVYLPLLSHALFGPPSGG